MNTPSNVVDFPQVTVRNMQVGGADGLLAARLYTSAAGRDGKAAGKAAKVDTLVVFFHGGGFVAGSIDEGDVFLSHLSCGAINQVVLSSSYTLATVKPFPAAVEDAHAVLLWSKKNKTRLGWSGKRLVVAGIEAGANLAAVCALMSRDRGGPELAGQILIMPMLDPALTTCSMREVTAQDGMAEVADTCAASYRGYLPNPADRTHPYASPLQSSRLKNLPPALVLSAEDDPLRDEAEQYAAKLSANGVTTTVKRMASAPLQDSGARNECACKAAALSEIGSFLAALDRSHPLSEETAMAPAPSS
ncbi:MAG: alpha/beta hydrolase [Massilia sp.]|nr:alpha/beta hydrolase [Massilia sp.]